MDFKMSFASEYHREDLTTTTLPHPYSSLPLFSLHSPCYSSFLPILIFFLLPSFFV